MSVFGGTLFSLLPLLSAEEVCRTLILAAIGTTVSFFMSWLLKRMMRRRK